MKNVFTHDICDWTSWVKVYQNITAWQPLIKLIFEKEGLTFSNIQSLTPGTNAVFRVGDMVVKIFAPKESGMDARSDYETELFGLKRTNLIGVSAPKLLANGYINDKYDFLYMVMEYIYGSELIQISGDLSDVEKELIGKKLRNIIKKMNTKCEGFNNVDVISRAVAAKQWNIFPNSFLKERIEWLKKYQSTNYVFVHGDLNPDNMLIDENMNIHIIDFADSVQAPSEYELAALVCETFKFEYSYMKGFFGINYNTKDITEKCFRSILMHDFGENIIQNNFGNPSEITSLTILKKRICKAIENEKSVKLKFSPVKFLLKIFQIIKRRE